MTQMTIRAANHNDKARMLEISAAIWDGTDYIPQVVDYWLSGLGGETLVVTLDEKTMGFARMTILGPDACWLEGIRVDEAARGLGLGKALTDAMVALAKAKAFKRIELSSFIENYESLAIIKSRGFQETLGFKYYESDMTRRSALAIEQLIQSNQWQYKRVSADEMTVDDLYASIAKSAGFKERGGYFIYDWTFKTLTVEDLAAFLNSGEVYAVSQGSTQNKTVAIGFFIMSKRYAKGDYQTLQWAENSQTAQAAIAYGMQAAIRSDENFNVMLPKGTIEAPEVYGLYGFTNEPLDAFVFEYKGE